MRRVADIIAIVFVLAGAGASPMHAADVRVSVLTSADGVSSNGPVSWLDGGFGKLPVGSALAGAGEEAGSLDLQTGVLVSLDDSARGVRPAPGAPFRKSATTLGGAR